MTPLEKYTRLHTQMVAAQRALITAAEAVDGNFTAAQQTEWDELDEDRKGYATQIKRHREIEAAELVAPVVRAYDPQAEARGDSARDPGPGAGWAQRLFGKAEPARAFRSLEEQMAVILSGQHHPALMAVQGENEGALGGFSLEEEHAFGVLNKAYEDSIVLSRANVEPMRSSEKVTWDFDMSSAAAGTLFGGFVGQWLPEHGTVDIKTAKLLARTLRARTFALAAQAGNNLLDDSPGFGGRLTEAMGKALGHGLDGAFFDGTGNGQPLGMLRDAATIEVAKETGQLPDTFVYENATKMVARLHPACFRNSVWVASVTAIPQLLSMTLGTGTSGVFFPALSPSGDGSYTLLSRPVLFTEQLPAIGDRGDVVLVELQQYTVGLRKEISADASAHVGFLQNQMTWRALSRVDGGGRWNKVYTPKNGSTLSWCVVLAARA